MRTPLSFARYATLTIAVLLVSSAVVPARGEAAEPARPSRPHPRRRARTAAPPTAEPLAPPPGPPSPVPAAAAAGIPATPAPQTQALGGHPEPASFPGAPAAVVEPASTIEVGVQRLPASAYPDDPIRGLKHSSLWLTFHGLQWPYMPSLRPGERFVIGLSGWGWIDTSYQKFSPWGDNPNIQQDRIKYWRQQARMLLRVTPTYALNRESFIQGQVELVGTGDQSIPRADVGGADTDDLWLRAGQWNKWDVQVGRFEGWEVFHLGMGLDFNTFERKGAVGPGESDTSQYYWPHGQPVSAGRRGRQLRGARLPAADPALRDPRHGGQLQRSRVLRTSRRDPRPRVAEAQGRDRIQHIGWPTGRRTTPRRRPRRGRRGAVRLRAPRSSSA